MYKKLLGFFVCTLLIATALPAIGTINIRESKLDDNQILKFVPGEFIVKFKNT